MFTIMKNGEQKLGIVNYRTVTTGLNILKNIVQNREVEFCLNFHFRARAIHNLWFYVHLTSSFLEFWSMKRKLDLSLVASIGRNTIKSEI